MIKYLKYSGASISITLNPYHWAWFPIVRKETDMSWDTESYRISLLFLTIRAWIDNGEW